MPIRILVDTKLPERNAVNCIGALRRATPASRIIALSIVQSGRYCASVMFGPAIVIEEH